MIELHWRELPARPDLDVAGAWAAEAWGGELVFTIFHFTDDGWMAVAEPSQMLRPARGLAEAQAACLELVKRRSF